MLSDSPYHCVRVVWPQLELESGNDNSSCGQPGEAMTFTVQATVMQTPTRDKLEVLEDVVITVDDSETADSGTITAIEPSSTFTGNIDVSLSADAILLPGMIDLHIHAPQWPQLGTGLDVPLEQWLFDYTFPLEARFTDLDFAAEVWTDLVTTLLRHGTTTAVYYATQDLAATTLLAKICVDLGQRAFVGRVAMDHPTGTPDWYRDATAPNGITDSRTSIEQIQTLGSDLVQPIITPRFIPACSDELLIGLGQLAAETGVRIQTHCSESDWEHGYVLERHGMSDTESLARFGLIQPGTVLAHADHVSGSDLKLLANSGAGIAHCPLSNAYFGDAVFPARRALEAGVHVGLGTDIAGGSEPGLLAQCAHAVTVSRHLEDGVDAGLARPERGTPDSRINTITAFWMATMGGANLLDAPIGLIEVGRQFDAFAVDPTQSSTSALRRWDLDDDARWFEKVVRLTRPADIDRVWVSGVQIG